MSEGAKELDAQGAGVGGQAEIPTGPAEKPTAGDQEQPTADATTEPKPVNLDDLPDFRNWKSSMDKLIDEQRRETERVRGEAEALKQEVAALRLRDAAPEDQVAYYQGELDRVTKEATRERERVRAEGDIYRRGSEMLAELGLNYRTPGLDFSGGQTPDGLAKLTRSAALIVRRQQVAQADAAAQQSTVTARQARQQGIAATGAAQVSTATGPSQPSKDLQEAYQAELAELRRGGGDRSRKLVYLKNKYRAQGLVIP